MDRVADRDEDPIILAVNGVEPDTSNMRKTVCVFEVSQNGELRRERDKPGGRTILCR
jgi:hypothetical protein